MSQTEKHTHMERSERMLPPQGYAKMGKLKKVAKVDPSGVSQGVYFPREMQICKFQMRYQLPAYLMELWIHDIICLCIEISFKIYKENNVYCL